MKIDKKRAWKALGIGVLISLPISLVYIFGESLEDTVFNAIAMVLIAPVALLMAPALIFVVWCVSYSGSTVDPDSYLLATYFYAIPFLSVAFYAVCAYGVLTFLAKKK